jgi:DNA-directed RNA polymerase specialized sigma24 family protein
VFVTADDLALRGGLLAFIYQLLWSPFAAEDVVQGTMERAAVAADSIQLAVTAPGTASPSC